ncbi:MAG TPA: SCO family protein [Gammaproteobacteria bacterium]|nr:SCO family protein [Gammaproteobacteria bacterium]
MRGSRLLALIAAIAVLALGVTIVVQGYTDNYQYHLTRVDDAGAEAPRPGLKLYGAKDSDGNVRRAADYQGDVVVLYAGYTHCPNVCPTTLAKLHAVRSKLSNDVASRIKVLFVSVDPKRDTEHGLGEYVAAFDRSFTGLRLTGDALERFESHFNVDVTYGKPDDQGDYVVNHSGAVYIFGPKGQLQLIGSPADSVEDLTADLRHLAG